MRYKISFSERGSEAKHVFSEIKVCSSEDDDDNCCVVHT